MILDDLWWSRGPDLVESGGTADLERAAPKATHESKQTLHPAINPPQIPRKTPLIGLQVRFNGIFGQWLQPRAECGLESAPPAGGFPEH